MRRLISFTRNHLLKHIESRQSWNSFDAMEHNSNVKSPIKEALVLAVCQTKIFVFITLNRKLLIEPKPNYLQLMEKELSVNIIVFSDILLSIVSYNLCWKKLLNFNSGVRRWKFKDI